MKTRFVKERGVPAEKFRQDLAALLEIPGDKRELIQKTIQENSSGLWDGKVKAEQILSLTVQTSLPTDKITDVWDVAGFLVYSLGRYGDSLDAFLSDLVEVGYLDPKRVDEARSFFGPVSQHAPLVREKRRIRDISSLGSTLESFAGICGFRHVRPREFDVGEDELDKYVPEKGQLVPMATLMMTLSGQRHEIVFDVTSQELEQIIKGLQALKKELDMLAESFPETEK